MDTNKKKKRWFRWYFCGRKDALRSFFINYDVRTNLGEEVFKDISGRVKKMGNLHYPEDYVSNGWDSLITNKELFEVLENPDNSEFNILSGGLNAKNKMKQLRAFLEEFMEMRKIARARKSFIIFSNSMGDELFEEFMKEFKKKYPKDNIDLIIEDKELEIPVIFGVIMKEVIKRNPYKRRSIQELAKIYIEQLPKEEKEYLAQIENWTRKMMEKYSVGHFGFEFYKGRSALGYCYTDKIGLNVVHCIEHHIDDVKDTILHEIAHAIVGIKNNHNKIWQEKAKELGASPYIRKQSPLLPRERNVEKNIFIE